ncbi:hypothetical protein JAO73_20915 [Hymenobacter sp. BT523]|uniref:beta strand repeat-containing protein n=1 Tax=Hymenobacter sp. BT523 TaxID=2795725 RepID=UPI0018EDFC0B|nr:hypothetical protein [Hymenobacter sp. BT523]MBJ6111496.1 hypothetical protein [Hymenobacter sp. BT523]
MKHIFTIAVALGALCPLAASAQVGVGTATPDAKSALDIRATDKGLLIPRLTAAQRTGITSPPQGLMVYQTDGTAAGGAQTGFWYYAGTGGWVYLDAAASGGLTLPYSGSYSGIGNAFGITNTGIGAGIVASSTLSTAVSGTASSGAGVAGASTSGTGVLASSGTGTALAANKSSSQTGRLAALTNANAANDSTAAYISTVGDRPALRAVNTATSGQAAIRGVKQAAAADGSGVEGVITTGATGDAAGVRGLDQSGGTAGSGVLGLTVGGFGVRGVATDGYGVLGSSTNGAGVFGSSQANSRGVAGVVGSGGFGADGVGVLGNSASGYGVRGVVTSGGIGVQGVATNVYGVNGISTSGAGVYGSSASGYGAQGSSTSSSGVFGQTAAGNVGGVAGVEGTSTNSSGVGVLGTTVSGYGVRGEATGTSGYGVTGVASSTNGIGVLGSATGGAAGVIGQASGTGRAGYFNQTSSTGTANALEVQNSSLGRTAYFNQSNASNTAAAVEINQSGTGPALNVRGSVVNSASTGSANMLPVAYGKVDDNGTILSGSGNFTVAHTANTGVYLVTLTSANLVNLDMDAAVFLVSLNSAFSGVRSVIKTRNGTSINNNRGAFAVDISNANSGSPVVPEERFSFVLYAP